MEQERPVFDLEGYWEVGALRDGSLELTMGDIAPGTGKVGDDDEFDNALGHLCGV